MRAHRESAGLTQEQLAEAADRHRTYISGCERGIRNVSLLNLVKFASALNLDLTDFIGPHLGDAAHNRKIVVKVRKRTK
ncbi:MAG: helix-turn-helix domain-containing protein [Actinomycetia bacterium]|nr:helix-turn-helix domain-containing protein [Actinomycetes bacterium]